jgi:hypothetical protein
MFSHWWVQQGLLGTQSQRRSILRNESDAKTIYQREPKREHNLK